MDWLVGIAIPLAGVLGGFIGAAWGVREARRARLDAKLRTHLSGLWSSDAEERAVAREDIHEMIDSKQLTRDQLSEAKRKLDRVRLARLEPHLSNRNAAVAEVESPESMSQERPQDVTKKLSEEPTSVEHVSTAQESSGS